MSRKKGKKKTKERGRGRSTGQNKGVDFEYFWVQLLMFTSWEQQQRNQDNLEPAVYPLLIVFFFFLRIILVVFLIKKYFLFFKRLFFILAYHNELEILKKINFNGILISSYNDEDGMKKTWVAREQM
jgi:hypothetical protein